jgi:hypothetical protein
MPTELIICGLLNKTCDFEKNGHCYSCLSTRTRYLELFIERVAPTIAGTFRIKKEDKKGARLIDDKNRFFGVIVRGKTSRNSPNRANR